MQLERRRRRFVVVAAITRLGQRTVSSRVQEKSASFHLLMGNEPMSSLEESLVFEGEVWPAKSMHVVSRLQLHLLYLMREDACFETHPSSGRKPSLLFFHGPINFCGGEIICITSKTAFFLFPKLPPICATARGDDSFFKYA